MEQIEAAGRIAGELEYIMELIPILHKLNYDDLHGMFGKRATCESEILRLGSNIIRI